MCALGAFGWAEANAKAGANISSNETEILSLIRLSFGYINKTRRRQRRIQNQCMTPAQLILHEKGASEVWARDPAVSRRFGNYGTRIVNGRAHGSETCIPSSRTRNANWST